MVLGVAPRRDGLPHRVKQTQQVVRVVAGSTLPVVDRRRIAIELECGPPVRPTWNSIDKVVSRYPRPLERSRT